MSLVDIKDLGIKIKDTSILNSVSLNLLSQDRISILGPSGSGKTSLVKFLLGVNPEDSVLSFEKAKLNSLDYLQISENEWLNLRRHFFGYLPQNPNFGFHPRFTVGEQAKDYVTKVLKVAWNLEQFFEYLNELGIDRTDSILNAKSSELSGGEKQRILLSLLFFSHPQVLIADEPTSALDKKTARSVFEAIDRFLLKTNSSLLLVTHDPEMAESKTDQMIFINKGVIVDILNRQNSKWESPNHSISTAFLAS
jgi:ABC-type glutathione transport system ATPase component